MSRVRRFVEGLALAATAAATLASAPVWAATSQRDSIALIDVMPGDQQAARLVMQRYLAEAHGDPGLLSAELLLQSGTSNHFILLQRFRDADAVDAHARLPFVRAYRTALFPLLGSPYDERLGSDPDPVR